MCLKTTWTWITQLRDNEILSEKLRGAGDRTTKGYNRSFFPVLGLIYAYRSNNSLLARTHRLRRF